MTINQKQSYKQAYLFWLRYVIYQEQSYKQACFLAETINQYQLYKQADFFLFFFFF